MKNIAVLRICRILMAFAGVWITGPVVGSGAAAEPAGPVPGSSAPARDIVAEATRRAYYAGKDVRLRAEMLITDRRGREKRRAYVVLRRNQEEAQEPGEVRAAQPGQQYYVYFMEPEDVRRMAFLAWKGGDGNDDRWLYLPALDLVQRIASAQKRTSFAGSTFLYEDIYGRRPGEDDHEWVETTDDYYVIRSTPNVDRDVKFASYTSWIHRDTFVTVRRQYADPSGSVYRTYDALKTERIGGHVTVTESRMEDLRSKGATTLRLEAIEYDRGLDPTLFTERYLRIPPAGVLHW